MTYSEETDFNHHKLEVGRYLTYLSAMNLSFNQNSVCLDFGAGHGMHAGFLAAKMDAVWAADIVNYSTLYDGDFFRLIREKHVRNDQPFDLNRINFVTTDGMDMVFRDCMFDSVVSFNVFEHVPDPNRALKEILRVLKPGGTAYITFDPIWTCDTGSHFSYLVTEPWAHLVLSTSDFCEKLLANGGTSEQCLEFRVAMNGWRLEQHTAAFDSIFRTGNAELLTHEKWNGTANSANVQHENFRIAISKGYNADELQTRGMMYLFRKTA